ncbi:hypothetical protein [Actinomadura gamaensis]
MVADDLKNVLWGLTGYQVWHSDAGVLYAVRSTPLSDAELNAGLSQTLVADDPHAMVVRLRTEFERTTRFSVGRGE